jgi:predicted site-specific integrase-resolvase
MSRKIRLSEWAKDRGVSKMTAWRRAAAGEIPGAYLSDAGRWMIDVPDDKPTLTVAYARVSSHDQKDSTAKLPAWPNGPQHKA